MKHRFLWLFLAALTLLAGCRPEPAEAAKPVIYLYPEEETADAKPVD